MAAWIASLREAAIERREGAAPQQLEALPEELAALYALMNGAVLLGEVRLHSLEEAPFPPVGEGAWRFGQKGSHLHLLALRKPMVQAALAGAPEPSWLSQVSEEDWLYGVKEGATGPLRLFRTLETMFGVLIPPPKEEFGEQTFARAVAAVHETLAGVAAKEALRSAPEKTPPDEEVTPEVANPLPPEAYESEEAEAKAPTTAAVKPAPAPKAAPAKPAAKKPAPGKPATGKVAPKSAAVRSSPAKQAAGRKPAKAGASRKAAKKAGAARKPAAKAQRKAAVRKAATKPQRAAAARAPARKPGAKQGAAKKPAATKSARGKRGGRK